MKRENLSNSRGLFIVFEGLDKTGKSTQSKLLVDTLNKSNMPTRLYKFPDRTTAIGTMIDKYLSKEIDLNDNTVHLLFSANRWETIDGIKSCIADGVNVVADRYAYSGVAYSAAKNKPDMTMDWCKSCDTNLPRPDVVFFMDRPNDLSKNVNAQTGSSAASNLQRGNPCREIPIVLSTRSHELNNTHAILIKNANGQFQLLQTGGRAISPRARRGSQDPGAASTPTAHINQINAAAATAVRGGDFGTERYEQIEFQIKVYKNFLKLFNNGSNNKPKRLDTNSHKYSLRKTRARTERFLNNVVFVDSVGDIEQIGQKIFETVKLCSKNIAYRKEGKLWADPHARN